MSAALSIQVYDRKVKRMLAKYEPPEMRRRLRRGVSAGARVYRTGLRSRAKSDPTIPDFFAKTKTKSGVRFGRIKTEVGPKSPLFNIFEGGADSHEIAPGRLGVGGRGLLLSGKAGDRWRSRDFVASMPVRHPGMKARPLAGPVFREKERAAKREVARTVFGDSSLGVFGLEELTDG